jgi:energy-coupling factor transport system ATP-binding protein
MPANQPSQKKTVVEFIDVTFGYTPKKNNLDNINISIYENEYVCIIGHNGSGKSTLSKVLVGLLKPKAGVIKIFNQEINKFNIKQLRDRVGIVFQNPDNQFVGLTPEDDIAFGLENRKIDPDQMSNIIREVAKITNIESLLPLDASRLSGGQKQRVAIASVLALNPNIIIFDESTSMLDPKAKIQLKNLMIILKEKYKKTVISITHDMEEVVNADRVIILKDGKMLQQGSPQEVFANRDFLKNISLDIPFVLQLSNLLNQSHSHIPLTLNINELIDKI